MDQLEAVKAAQVPRLSGPGALGTADPSGIVALATAYWGSMALFTASRLDVFSMLFGDGRSADDVASRCGAHPRPIAMLLNACVALGLLQKAQGLYRNSPAADAFLTRGKPTYLGDALKYSEDLYPVWGKLGEAVRANAPPICPETMLGADSERTRNFVLGMHNRARGVAASLAACLDLTGRKRLLDVGGGPGTYSTLLVQRTPGLRATILDLPAVVAIARELLAASGCGDRIDTVAGDYTVSPFQPGNDAVLLSGVLHRETPETCQALLRKAFGSLVPGGLLVVGDVFLDDEGKDSPLFATLFALNMLLTSQHGSAHAKTEMHAWMSQAGFVDLESKPLPPPMPHTIILGTRP